MVRANMKRALFLLSLLATPASAGSITITLNAPTTTGTLTATATISDADAQRTINWAQTTFAGVNNGQAATPAGAFQVLMDSMAIQLAQQVMTWLQQQAAAAAAESIPPLVITPAQ